MDETTVPVCVVVPEGVRTTGDPGMTIETLSLTSGFYRASYQSREVLKCHRKEACMGGSDASRYCAKGYAGPCEWFSLLITYYLKAVRCVTSIFHGAFLSTHKCIFK